jgi:CheY-like chemotaxis protein
LGEGAVFSLEMAVDAVASPGETPEPALAGRQVAVVSPSPVVGLAAALQVEAAGGQALRFHSLGALQASPQPVDLILYDIQPGVRLRAPPRRAPTLVLIPPEGRSRIPAIRAQGYAGYLIKPLRRASLEARALAAFSSGVELEPAAEDDRIHTPAAAGLHVLLAEDNPVNALLASVMLRREGCRVEHVMSGGEAVEAAQRAPYDLILLDLRMPGMDGLAAARALRQAGIAAPIAALTANAFEDDRRACREAGMDGFLTKPIQRDALLALLARRRAAA